MSDKYDPDETDLRVTEVNLKRPFVSLDHWTERRKAEQRSMIFGNVIAVVIIVAAVIFVIAVLTQ